MTNDTQPSETFENRLQKLQHIVRSLEQGELPLAESIDQYEQGSRLLKECHLMLKQAELKVQQVIKVDDQGNPILEDIDSSSTADQKQGTAGRRTVKKSVKKKSTAAEPESNKGSLFEE